MIPQPIEYDRIGGLLDKAKRTAVGGFATNFFVPQQHWPSFFRRGAFSICEHLEGCVFGRKEDACIRVYFAGSADCRWLSCLHGIEAPASLVVDLIGIKGKSETTVRTLADEGFAIHETIFRLSRKKVSEVLRAGPSSVEVACASDAAFIKKCLENEFDPLADQLPDADEVLKAVCDGFVYVFKDSAMAKGFIWWDRVGVTATIRYLCVERHARAHGIGRSLVEGYFRKTPECARHLIWVRSRNLAALSCYTRLGYQQDGVEDIVMVK
jgi:ribosomal protein S18 acetylase RimI-like enzyme